MELRFFYADKAVFGDDVTADHGLAHDSEEALGEFVIAGDFHGVGAEQIELIGVGLAVCLSLIHIWGGRRPARS